MKRQVLSIFVLGLLSSWLAFSHPAVENLTAKNDSRLPPSLLENRLALCHSNSLHERGCSAAFRYLEELADINARPIPLGKDEDLAKKFRSLQSRLNSANVPESEWVSGAFNAWLLAVDPHAKLVAADDSDRRASAEKIYVQGAGARLRFHRDKVYVGYTMEGSAAEASGMRSGDRIISLNGRPLDRLNETAKRRWLSQTVSPYKIQIERDGTKRAFDVVERRYFLANVEASLRKLPGGKKEGVLRVRSFDKDNTCDDMRHALAVLTDKSISRIRLDLRDNPGGLVREAQCSAALFLGKEKIFAKLRRLDLAEARDLIPATPAGGSFGEEDETVLRTPPSWHTSLPLVVEVNQNSASAAEMLAAALQDNGRARVEGSRSFGKGSMQSVFHPWADEKLYLTRTTHAIFRPNGKALQFQGVVPDQILLPQEGENFPRERELTL